MFLGRIALTFLIPFFKFCLLRYDGTIINLILLYNLTFKNTQQSQNRGTNQKNERRGKKILCHVVFSIFIFPRKITSIFPHEDLVMKYALYNHLSFWIFFYE